MGGTALPPFPERLQPRSAPQTALWSFKYIVQLLTSAGKNTSSQGKARFLRENCCLPLCIAQLSMRSRSYCSRRLTTLLHAHLVPARQIPLTVKRNKKNRFSGFTLFREWVFWKKTSLRDVSGGLISAYTWQEVHASGDFPALLWTDSFPKTQGILVIHLLEHSACPLVELFGISRHRRQHLSNPTYDIQAGESSLLPG